ncbi:hypothetical protein [Bernardetia litoralis]|uniref:hypothetical protein n=1 Tax=Bernardetia litoralis TaxID=999 RepID=UPI0012FE5A52|nr:hypothetical protein [Bernardetia litoralis]
MHPSISRITFILLLLPFCFNDLYAQECGTSDIQPEEAMNYPWFGNPDYLSAFMDSVTIVDGIPSQNPSISSIVPDIK